MQHIGAVALIVAETAEVSGEFSGRRNLRRLTTAVTVKPHRPSLYPIRRDLIALQARLLALFHYLSSHAWKQL